jgi:hypothetical protein
MAAAQIPQLASGLMVLTKELFRLRMKRYIKLENTRVCKLYICVYEIFKVVSI